MEIPDSSSEVRTYHVMLVDSHPVLGEQLKSILDEPNTKVIATTDWRRALKLLLEGRIELAVCDVDLPNEGARQIHATIKAENPTRLSRVVFARNTITRPDVDFLCKVERRDLLDKPFNHDQVRSVLLKRLYRSTRPMVS